MVEGIVTSAIVSLVIAGFNNKTERKILLNDMYQWCQRIYWELYRLNHVDHFVPYDRSKDVKQERPVIKNRENEMLTKKLNECAVKHNNIDSIAYGWDKICIINEIQMNLLCQPNPIFKSFPLHKKFYETYQENTKKLSLCLEMYIYEKNTEEALRMTEKSFLELESDYRNLLCIYRKDGLLEKRIGQEHP